MAKLHLYLLNRPLGDELEVPPYGLFKNGQSYDIDAVDEDGNELGDITIGDPNRKDEIPRFKIPEDDPNPGADQPASDEPSPPVPVKQDMGGVDQSDLPEPRPAIAEPKKEAS